METLVVKNLSKRYETFTLDNISFVIPKGYIMGFIGENGAGKTTTINSLLNIINKDKGTVSVSISLVSELEDKVLSEGRKSGFKFSSIPLTQVSPAYKTVTYALGVDYIDTTVTPEESIYSTSSTYLNRHIHDVI